MTTDSTKTPVGEGSPIPPWLFRIVARLHTFLNRLTGGRRFNTYLDKEVCFVTMKGAKSGRLRTIPLMYIPYKDGLLLVASQGGAHKNPDWYYNVLKHSEIAVNHRGRGMKLVACLATAEEKADLWPICDQHFPPFAEYRTRTNRDIPIFVCEPLD